VGTPVLHFLGSLDSVVEESRTLSLVEACEGEGVGRVIYHPGGHFLPSQRLFLDRVAGFVRECVEGVEVKRGKKEKEEEESVEDMDVPF